MIQQPANYVHCVTEELVDLLILGPEELTKEERAHLIYHLATCSSCRQVASILANFYMEFLLSERENGTQKTSRP